jgi:Mg-chelatase subunit ChlI
VARDADVEDGVDAAGLYVGMTRGRHTNTALVIARTPDKAVEHLADTMMRGKLEVTLDDARRASRIELGRAARDSDAQPRKDARRELASRIAAAEERRRALRNTLRETDASAANAEATGHGRPDSRSARRAGTDAYGQIGSRSLAPCLTHPACGCQ